MLFPLTLVAQLAAAAAAAGPVPPPASSPALEQPSASSSPSPSAPVASVAPPASPPAANGAEAASIGFFTADSLARRCQDSSPTAISYCYAYITAVHDTMKAYEIWLNQKEFCIKGGDAQADLRRAFLTYLSAYPENRTGQAASVVGVALKQTYTCPVSRP